jgi:transcriptional regulator with XRE-family HTH domain
MTDWEKRVLSSPGAPERVIQIEEELRLAAGLTSLREQAGLTQRQLAALVGVRQPRIAAIERSHNITFDVLERYVAALGGHVELSVVRDGETIPIITGHRDRSVTSAAAAKSTTRKVATPKAAPAKRTPAKAAKRLATTTTPASAKRAPRRAAVPDRATREDNL